MCGILGVHPLTKTSKQLLPLLGYEMESRGRDSWGMTDGTNIVKKLGKISQSFEYPYPTWDSVIYHCRAASVGEVNIENQHPFIFPVKDSNDVIVGIHNGTLTNHTEANNKRDLDFDVDTKHIYHTLANDLDFNDLQGSAALAWYELSGDHPPTLNLGVINSSNLHIAKLATGELIFASTKRAVEIAIGMTPDAELKEFLTVDSNTLYKVTEDGIEKIRTAEFGTIKTTQQNPARPVRTNTRGYSGSRTTDYERQVRENRIKSALGIDNESSFCYNCQVELNDNCDFTQSPLCFQCMSIISLCLDSDNMENKGYKVINYGYSNFEMSNNSTV